MIVQFRFSACSVIDFIINIQLCQLNTVFVQSIVNALQKKKTIYILLLVNRTALYQCKHNKLEPDQRVQLVACDALSHAVILILKHESNSKYINVKQCVPLAIRQNS